MPFLPPNQQRHSTEGRNFQHGQGTQKRQCLLSTVQQKPEAATLPRTLWQSYRELSPNVINALLFNKYITLPKLTTTECDFFGTSSKLNSIWKKSYSGQFNSIHFSSVGKNHKHFNVRLYSIQFSLISAM